VMEERHEELMELQRGISFDKNVDLVGTKATVLVDQVVAGDSDYSAVGRTAAQALDVDGVTHIRAPAELHAGDMTEVRIVDALDYDLVAEVVSELE